MTPCPDEIKKWSFLNGEMEADAAEAFSLHLRDCPACREEMEALRKTIVEIRALPVPDAPAAWTAKAKASLVREAAPAQVRRIRFSRRFSLVSGGVLFAAVLTLAVIFPIRIPAESIALFFRTPANLPLSESARELLGKILVLLPLLFVPSIVENIRFLVRRKHRNPPTHLRLFSI
ncbi:MAG: hypothetical protein JW843_11495 [Candidatus Aminicenantes bacterium]|nr:hypothetical protein [Candidatus Aminicenantes bacterium]